jgi:hypothetical protein
VSPAPTVPIIVCRGDEYHSAGEVFGQIATDAATTHGGLLTVLSTYGGMAGNDSVGTQWAGSYDQGAQLAIATAAKLTTACGQTRDLLVISAYNHEVAEIAANHRNLPSPTKPQLTIDPCLAETVASAAGSGIPEPFGWSILKDAVGAAWPDGHQDQLDAAKDAWHTASSDYRTLAGNVSPAVDLLNNQQSPEIQTSIDTCNQRKTDFNALADACQSLGDACGEYANHLDEAHRKILDELQEFLLEAAAWEVGAAILTPFTGTISEWIGNSALAGRVAMKARRIATIIGELATKVAKLVADAVKPLVERLKPLLERVRKWVEDASTKLARDGKTSGPRTGPAASSAERDEMIQQLQSEGIKFDPDKVVQIGRDSDGKIIFLEQGNKRAGLQHILSHATDFANKGVSQDEIPELVTRAATQGEKVGISGRDRPIYQIMHNGTMLKIAVTIGSNGFIVGANPVS